MGRILVRGEAGHDIISELYPAANEPVIDKPGKGAFYQTDLDLMLRNRGIDTLLVCGVTTEVCVNTTVREANDRGYRCIVLSDCCASYFPQFHEMGLAMIKAQGGIFGSVASSQSLLSAMAVAAYEHERHRLREVEQLPHDRRGQDLGRRPQVVPTERRQASRRSKAWSASRLREDQK